MKRMSFLLGILSCLFAGVSFFASHTSAQNASAKVTPPLTLVQTIDLDVPTFPYTDHLEVDLKGHRLFAAIAGSKSVTVSDINAGKVIHNIPVVDPHAILYRDDLSQIYVTDGDPAGPGVKMFNGRDYSLIKSIKLLPRTDSAGYDSRSKYWYVVNGGEAAKLNYSLLSIIDTTKMEKVGDIKIAGETLEQMVLEGSGPRLYLAIEEKGQVAVVDVNKRAVVDTWQITKGKLAAAIALDEANHRLFVGCRTTDMHGHIVIIDTQSGKELDTLPISGHVDQMFFDAPSKRIYAADGIAVVVYQERDPNHYSFIGKADTGLMSKTGLLVPELHRYFASVPHLGSQAGKILVFQTK